MEIKHVKEYEKPKFSSFQLKTGKILVAGAACLALLCASSTLQGCASTTDGEQPEALLGDPVALDFTDENTNWSSF